jgi:predicted enzyme related to lactoylglutathione lyase
MPESRGKFCWYELMTSDPDAAERFYRDVVGWGARDAGHPEMRYTLLTAGEVPVAGLMALPEEARAAGGRPGWMGYVAVDDVDRAAARVKEKGGKVHRAPADIPSIGRFAVAADPHGAIIVLFREAPGSMPPPPPAMPETPGFVGWRELMAGDLETAFAFYADLFGWTKAEAHDMGPIGVYQLFAAGGETIGGMMTKPASAPAPFWTYYFQVDGINAASERIKAGGGSVMHGPMEVPGGSWIVQALDPQGAMFALVSRKP